MLTLLHILVSLTLASRPSSPQLPYTLSYHHHAYRCDRMIPAEVVSFSQPHVLDAAGHYARSKNVGSGLHSCWDITLRKPRIGGKGPQSCNCPRPHFQDSGSDPGTTVPILDGATHVPGMLSFSNRTPAKTYHVMVLTRRKHPGGSTSRLCFMQNTIKPRVMTPQAMFHFGRDTGSKR